jgi:MFS family permease
MRSIHKRFGLARRLLLSTIPSRMTEPWLQLLSGLILAPVVNEFHFNGPFLSLASNVGLLVGAVFWGLGCDIWGRRYVCTYPSLHMFTLHAIHRWSFNITLFIAGLFGLAASGAPNFVALASLFAVVGVGVGGLLSLSLLTNTRL